jgi:hypothetical protein
MDSRDLFTGSSEVRRMAARPAAFGGGPAVYVMRTSLLHRHYLLLLLMKMLL